MPSFRIIDQFPTYLDMRGLPASGGVLRFYDTGTTTPKNVYADPDLTINNGSSVAIGTDGRSVKDIWGSGSYRVRLEDRYGALIHEADDVEIPGGEGTVIPSLVAGQFLTNNGSTLQWTAIRQVPDPTGQSGKFLSTDGVNMSWVNGPSTPPPATSDVDVLANGVTISDGTSKILIQTGTGSAPNVGGRNTNVAITFGTAFNAPPLFVGITPTYNSVSPFGNGAIPRVSVQSATGCTVNFTAGELDDSNSGFNFNAAIPFTWVAIGLVNV